MDTITEPTADMTNAQVPEELVAYAKEAIRRGYENVALIHATEADVPAPIGWLLWLIRDRKIRGENPLVSYMPGDDVNQRIALAPLAPLEVAPYQPVDERLLEMFGVGARNCWDMTYGRDLVECAFAAKYNLGMRHTLKGSAIDWVEPCHNSHEVYVSRRVGGGHPDQVVFVDQVSTDLPLAEAALQQPAPHRRSVVFFDETTGKYHV